MSTFQAIAALLVIPICIGIGGCIIRLIAGPTDVSTWHERDGLMARKLPDGQWEYRAMTDAEAAEWQLTKAW